MTRGHWCERCDAPVDAGDVLHDFGAEGDGHRVARVLEGWTVDEDGPEYDRIVYDGLCDGPVRRVG